MASGRELRRRFSWRGGTAIFPNKNRVFREFSAGRLQRDVGVLSSRKIRSSALVSRLKLFNFEGARDDFAGGVEAGDFPRTDRLHEHVSGGSRFHGSGFHLASRHGSDQLIQQTIP